MGPTNKIKVKLLGGFSAALPWGVPVKLAGKKNRALLAYLAMGQGKRHDRQKLMGLLWSDRGQAQARGSLRQALSALKEALAGRRVGGAGPGRGQCDPRSRRGGH